MMAVTEGFGDRSSAAAQEDTVLARYVVKMAVAITRFELAQAARHQKWAVLGRNHFNGHGNLLQELHQPHDPSENKRFRRARLFTAIIPSNARQHPRASWVWLPS